MAILFFLLIIVFLLIWGWYEFKKFGLSLTFMSLVWSIVIYGLAPIALIFSYNEVASPRFLVNSYDIESIIYVIPVIVFFMSMYFGSIFVQNRKIRINLKLNTKNIRKTSIVVFMVGFFSLMFFIYGYGGLDYVLSNMSNIRSGTDENKNYLAAFIVSFSKYMNLAFFIMLSLIFLSKNIQKKDYSILIIMAFFTLFSVYLSAGREAGIAFLISILVIYLAVYKKIPIIGVMVFSLLVFFYILFGKTFLFAINNENFDKDEFLQKGFSDTLLNSYNIIISEFTHQYLSLVNFMAGNHDFRFFGDYGYWLFKPFKLLGMNIPDSISYYNTYIVYGNWDSEIPPGAIAFGYIQMGILGVIIHGFLLGAFFKFFDVLFYPKRQDSPLLLGFYALSVTSFTYILSNSDPALFLQNRIPNILFLVLLLMFFNVRLLRK